MRTTFIVFQAVAAFATSSSDDSSRTHEVDFVPVGATGNDGSDGRKIETIVYPPLRPGDRMSPLSCSRGPPCGNASLRPPGGPRESGSAGSAGAHERIALALADGALGIGVAFWGDRVAANDARQPAASGSHRRCHVPRLREVANHTLVLKFADHHGWRAQRVMPLG